MEFFSFCEKEDAENEVGDPEKDGDDVENQEDVYEVLEVIWVDGGCGVDEAG